MPVGATRSVGSAINETGGNVVTALLTIFTLFGVLVFWGIIPAVIALVVVLIFKIATK